MSKAPARHAHKLGSCDYPSTLIFEKKLIRKVIPSVSAALRARPAPSRRLARNDFRAVALAIAEIAFSFVTITEH
jgi:hypothetical protein